MAEPEKELNMARPAVEVREGAGGARYLRSPQPLGAYPAHLGLHLRRWAEKDPGRLFLQERRGASWRRVSYGEALARAEALGEHLLALGLDAGRPLMVLSGNSIDHALLMLAAHATGIPIAPLSPAYSLMSQDFGKLRHAVAKVRPAALYVEAVEPFRRALAALQVNGRLLIVGPGGGEAEGWTCLPVAELGLAPAEASARAAAALGPASVAKILFTSGSTGLPKGVITTHGMLCANQQMIAQVWPFLVDEPPQLVEWLPWNHCFGGNHDFNMVLAHGGTLTLDAGKPLPGLIEETVRNLREVAPTLYFNVPAGFAQLLPYLERDAALRANFFRRLRLIFYAGAALPQDSWRRLEDLALGELGRKVAMVSAWGSTETSPAATTVHFPIERAGVIGLPLPGVELKLLPSGGKQEVRVRGPLVTPGYLDEPGLTAAAFDEEGFYKIGDAVRLVDEACPEKGVAFDGRVAEDFKLTSGTWVNVGGLRVALLSACPLLQDAVLAGHDRDEVGLLAWPNLQRCRDLAGDPERTSAELVADPVVRQSIVQALAAHNLGQAGQSSRVARCLLLAEPPSIDRGEITDKGYVNQRATLENRADAVDRLFAEMPPGDVLVFAPWPPHAAELLALEREDQRVRAELVAEGTLFDGYHPRMNEVHDRNAARLRDIVARHGWPGKAQVGEEAANAAWLVLQHAIAQPDLQRQGLGWLEDAVARGDAPAWQLASLRDRVARFEGRPQRYGTQFDWNAEGEMSPDPLEDPARVDAWRAEVGLGPLADAQAKICRSVAAECEKPPANLDARRREYEAWLRRVGWR